jgi:NIMA (never in mitosis gene a)-related kinase
MMEKLGEGAYSTVHKVKRLSDDSLYAMKKVKMGTLKTKEKENALNEVRILASVNHPNIVEYKEVFLDDATNTLCIVMEYAD